MLPEDLIGKQVREMQEKLKKGMRIELIYLHDPWCKIPKGTRGTVDHIDSLETAHVNWDNGSTLGIIPEIDKWREVKKGERKRKK